MADVRLRGIKKSFGKVDIIHGVDLDIEDGEFCVFVGPSGCGKSTLLRLVAGLEDITSGDLMIDGDRVNEVAPKDRGVAMVFQSYALYPHMSVYENMAFGLQLAKTEPGDADQRVREAATILQLDELLERKPKQLSGGQRQRVAIGRAIVRKPRVFLFDEPLSNLDAALRVQMRIELAKLHGDLGATMIYVTHDQVEAMTLADKIVVLNAGYVEQVGTPLELYHHPQNAFVAGFIGSPRMNFLAAEVVAADPTRVRVRFAGDLELDVPADGSGTAPGAPLTLGLRPEHLVEGGEGEAPFRGTVEVAEHLGESTYLYVHGAGDESVLMKASGDTVTGAGDALESGVSGSACYLFDRDGQALPRLGVESAPLARQIGGSTAPPPPP
jgi:ABC-type sugar transport system ATPase subunit